MKHWEKKYIPSVFVQDEADDADEADDDGDNAGCYTCSTKQKYQQEPQPCLFYALHPWVCERRYINLTYYYYYY